MFDVLEREVANLLDGETAPGTYELPFTRGDLDSGVYFVQLDVGGARFVRAMTVVAQ